MRIDDINRCDAQRFVELLGGIFEHSPWVAESVINSRPFAGLPELHAGMVDVVNAAPRERRLDLLCQHPELAGKEAEDGSLTEDSKREQAGAGLDQCSREELERINRNNREYSEKFGFPFIIAVTGLDKFAIIAAMERRLGNTPDDEFETALGEVEKIALMRLEKLIDV